MSVPLRATFYYLLALSFSWGYWGWMIAQGQVSGPDTTASHLPGLAGPALAALVVTAFAEGRPGLARLLPAMLPRGLRKPGVLALIALPPVLAFASFALQAARGQPWPDPQALFAYPGLPATLSAPLGVLIVLLLNGFGEETGWRGYLLPQLLHRVGAFWAVLAVAFAWLVWHLPLFWVNQPMMEMAVAARVGWGIGLILGAFALAHLWDHSGRSIGTVAIWHVVYNYCVATPPTGELATAVVSTAVMIWGLAVAVWWAMGHGPSV